MTFDPLVPRPIDLPTDVPLDAGADLSILDEAKILAAPDDPQDWPRWREQISRWRDEARNRIEYNDSIYSSPQSVWTTKAASVALVWLWDELLFDFGSGRFTPDRFLADAQERFGGHDAVVLWHAYPVIGIDDRNQFDFYQVPGLKELVAELKSAGLKIFLDYNPWDLGTRRHADSDGIAMSKVAEELGADGVFLDTLKEGDPVFLEELLSRNPDLALEGESRVPLRRISDHSLSWAQWFADSTTPGVLRAKWFEQRHMMHHTRRWNHDHSDELQSAWINGCGILVWEVVFGVWVGWNQRDLATHRYLVQLHRQCHELFSHGQWEPLVDLHPAAHRAGISASKFSSGSKEIWCLINRSNEDYQGPLLVGDSQVFAPGQEVEIAGEWVSACVPARGIAALARGATLTSAAVEVGLDSHFPEVEAKRVTPSPSTASSLDRAVVCEGTAKEVVARFRSRETALYDEAIYVEEWKPLPPRLHAPGSIAKTITFSPFAIGLREVTNRDYFNFIQSTSYSPDDDHRFLLHWIEGAPLAKDLDLPVTFVDLNDARAYAIWVGARLPSEWEWVHAEGSFERLSPRVWNLTESEYSDGRTRFSILVGSSDYQALGSDWYFDGGDQGPGFMAKWLHTGRGLARSSSIGFRCAVDLT